MFIFVMMLIGTLQSLCQTNDCFSVAINTDCRYSFWGDNVNGFSYGLSAAVAKKVHKMKMSVGVGYSTKSFHSRVNTVYAINSVRVFDYDLKYLCVPIIAGVDIFRQRGSVYAGFVFDWIMNYYVTRNYQNGGAEIEMGLLDDRRLGVGLIGGVSFLFPFGKSFLLDVSPFAKCVLLADHADQRPGYMSIPNDKLSVGLRIGVEYMF